jgi:cell division septum initiation protein DivIVA
MQIRNILKKLRKEMAETEHAITQAWQRYSKELSTKALAEAAATTKRLAALHRRLASRLEHIAGEGRRRWSAHTRRTPQNPPDAPPPMQTPPRSA